MKTLTAKKEYRNAYEGALDDVIDFRTVFQGTHGYLTGNQTYCSMMFDGRQCATEFDG